MKERQTRDESKGKRRKATEREEGRKILKLHLSWKLQSELKQ